MKLFARMARWWEDQLEIKTQLVLQVLAKSEEPLFTMDFLVRDRNIGFLWASFALERLVEEGLVDFEPQDEYFNGGVLTLRSFTLTEKGRALLAER